MPIRFVFESTRYLLPDDAYGRGCWWIRLPDGRHLRIGEWLESSPPIPAKRTLVERLPSGVKDAEIAIAEAVSSGPALRPPRSIPHPVFVAVDQATAWLDGHHPRTRLRLLLRFLKVGDELGEAIEALSGICQHNPRKTHRFTVEDLALELADVAVTALVAIRSLAPDVDAARLTADIADRRAASDQPDRQPDPTADPAGRLTAAVEAMSEAERLPAPVDGEPGEDAAAFQAGVRVARVQASLGGATTALLGSFEHTHSGIRVGASRLVAERLAAVVVDALVAIRGLGLDPIHTLACKAEVLTARFAQHPATPATHPPTGEPTGDPAAAAEAVRARRPVLPERRSSADAVPQTPR